MQQLSNNQRLSDEDFLIEFDNLVNTALSRKNFNIPETSHVFNNELNLKHLGPHSSMSSCSSMSSINSYRPYNYSSTNTGINFEKNCLNNYTEREISLNKNSYYKVDKENLDYNLTNKYGDKTTVYSSIRNKTNTLKKSNYLPMTKSTQFEPKKLENYSISPKLRKNDKIKTSSTRTSLISQPPDLITQKSTNLDDTELDVSEVCQFSETECMQDLEKINMCSSLIQESNSDDSSLSRKKKRVVLVKQPKRNSKTSNMALNIGFLPSLLNDLIIILIKYLNKTNSMKSGRKNNQTNKIDTKCVKLMNKKVRIATLFNFITKLLMETNSSKKRPAKFSLESSLFAILAETANEKPAKIKRRSKIYSPSISSFSNESSTTSDSSIYMDKMDTSFDENEKLPPDQSNESSSEDQNDQKWQAQLEIPNIEDPALFIDTLYNQLLANNETDVPIKQDEYQHQPVDQNSICSEEPLSEVNSSSSEDNDHFGIEDSLKQDLTLNDDVSNNDLSLIDYSYLIANHTLERSDLKVEINNTKELVIKDYVSLNPNIVDWNYEDETADYHDVSINSIELDKTDMIERFDFTNPYLDPPVSARELITKQDIMESIKIPDNLPSINTEFLKEIKPLGNTFQTNFLISPTMSLSSPSLSISSLSTTKSSFSSNFRDNILKSNISFGRDLFSASSSAKNSDLNDLSITSENSKTSEDDLKILDNSAFISPRTITVSQNCNSLNQISSINGLLIQDIQKSSASVLNKAGETPQTSTWFSSFVKSVKYVVLSKNIVLLPMILYLINSKFKNSASGNTMTSNLANGVARTTVSAALATLNAMARK